jgi:hypothetical protein
METNFTVEQLCEFHGIYRQWGHPKVDKELGCENVKKIAQDRKMVDQNVLTEMLGLFKREFVTSFISKHGRWPRSSVPETMIKSPLHHASEGQFQVLHLHSPKYPMQDWAEINFDKGFEFDSHLDYTELTDDKSLAVHRDEIRSLCSPEKLKYTPPRPSTERRCVRELLSRETLDIKDICDTITLGLKPDKWKILILHAKERELKIAPRLFAMMTLEMRLYFCVTEQNISELFSKTDHDIR